MRPLAFLEARRFPVVPRLAVVGAHPPGLGPRDAHRGLLQREIGGLEVALQVHRGKVQGRADVVEAAGGAVLGQKIAQGRVDAEEVVQRLDILVAVEPAVDDPSLALLLRPAEPVQFAAQGVQEGPIHFRGGPFFLLRRHLAALHLVEDLRPLLQVLDVVRAPLQGGEVQSALLRVGVVALVAVLVEHRLQPAAELSGAGDGGGETEEGDAGREGHLHRCLEFGRSALGMARARRKPVSG